MSKTVKIILSSFILAVLITAGTYFISHSSQVSFSQPSGECALPNSETPLLSESQNETNRGFPATYDRDTLHQLAGGICGPTLEHTNNFSYVYAALDMLLWWALTFAIIQVFTSKKK